MTKTPSYRPKSYTTPVWLLGIAGLVKGCLIILAMVSVRLYYSKKGQTPVTTYYILDWIMITVVLAQAYTYWLFRKKNYRKSWALSHALLTMLAFLLIPLFYSLVLFLLSNSNSLRSQETLVRTLNTLRFYLFWIFLAAGNIFYTLSMVSVYQARNQSFRDAIDAIGNND